MIRASVTRPFRHKTASNFTRPRTLWASASGVRLGILREMIVARCVTSFDEKIGPLHLSPTLCGSRLFWPCTGAIIRNVRKNKDFINVIALFIVEPVCCESSSPAQFVAQHLEIVSVHRLNEVESRLALANQHAVLRLQWKSHLPIESQRHAFICRL